jgi:hypothetical protein
LGYNAYIHKNVTSNKDVIFFPLTKMENRRAEQVLLAGVGTSGRSRCGKGYGRVNIVKVPCTCM